MHMRQINFKTITTLSIFFRLIFEAAVIKIIELNFEREKDAPGEMVREYSSYKNKYILRKISF